MSITNIIGFETGSTFDSASVVGTPVASTSNVHGGSYSLEISAPASTATNFNMRGYNAGGNNTNTLSSSAAGALNMYLYPVTLPAGESMIAVARFTTAAGSHKWYLTITSTGQLKAYDGTANTLIGSSTYTLPTGSYSFVAVTWTGISGAGSLTVYAGTTAATATSQITGSGLQLGGTNSTTNVLLGRASDVTVDSSAYDIYYDDIIIGSATTDLQTSDYKIVQLRPTSNGTTMQWTSGTAPSNYTTVADLPYNVATYVMSTGSAGDKAQFNLTSPTTAGIASGSTILGTKVLGSLRDDITAANTVQLQVTSGGSTTSTTTSNTNTSAMNYGLLSLTDPATSAAWTTTGLAAVMIGATENSAAATRLTDIGLDVAYRPAANGANTTNFFAFF